MRIVAIEEHVVVPAVLEAWARAPSAAEDRTAQFGVGSIGERLSDCGERRLGEMDDDGVSVQVVSLNSPGVQNLTPAEAVPLAREANDAVAALIAPHPDRFDAFATLPTPDPAAAAEELRRAVGELGMPAAMLNGRTGRRNIDDPELADLWATAAELGAPIYIHPQLPVPEVRAAYYTGHGDDLDAVFAAHGLGWHYETGVQLLRLILSGTFDRHPELQVITGHWGEVVLFFLERLEILDRGSGLERPIADYLRQNVHYTPSGMLSQRYLRWTVDLVGVDRIMYSIDYPYRHAGGGAARRFLEQAELSEAEREAIAHGNWEALTRGVT